MGPYGYTNAAVGRPSGARHPDLTSRDWDSLRGARTPVRLAHDRTSAHPSLAWFAWFVHSLVCLVCLVWAVAFAWFAWFGLAPLLGLLGLCPASKPTPGAEGPHPPAEHFDQKLERG